MPDMLAIISKAVFEKESGGQAPGDLLPLDRYRSASRHLEPLRTGGALFLVTVRPPAQALWLVAVLEGPHFEEQEWRAAPNRVPITDITARIPQLRFESGKGLTAAPGALGMSLQTPRVLTPEDVALLRGGTDGAPAGGAREVPRVNLTAHDERGPLPCLCRRCLPTSGERAEAGGLTFLRDRVELPDQELYYWLPEELAASQKEVARSVQGALRARRGGG